MSNEISPPTDKSVAIRKQSHTILIALLFPTMAIIMNGSMFAVALPTIRNEFTVAADVAAWLAIAFSLPFMMLMPLYGRLGDELGRSRLLLLGIILFLLGSILALSTNNLPLLFLGRVIQGAGSAGITPLSLAIIAQRFPVTERGRALGTWNSIAPATSIFAPSIGGFLVDSLGWHTIFIPIIFVGIFAIIIVHWQIPTLRGKPNWAILPTFDWGGVLLLNGTIIFLILYISSRPVTGVEALQDWRLLLGTVLLGFGFVTWEKRRIDPLIDLRILQSASFRLASISAALRMAMMMGISFLIPLYLTDIYNLSASTIGLLASAHSIALFVSIRFGGTLADRWPNKWLVTSSLGIQTGAMAYFALLPGAVSLLWIVVGAITHGLAAGISLAALHRTALDRISPKQTGAAAGIYSMIRFAGSMLATAFAGVILQNGLDKGLRPLQAYQIVYGFLAILGFMGMLLAYRLKE
ncbi:MAG: MFS transporter [Chloroflexi bacterium]|nr:MFS transporter [Chloroflexota bacterium]